jgi:hypothetical protein
MPLGTTNETIKIFARRREKRRWTTTRNYTMAIKTKYKLPKEGNQVQVTYSSGKTKVSCAVYVVLDKFGKIDKEATEARIEHVGSQLGLDSVTEEVIEAPVEEVTVEEVVEEVIEEVCCDEACEDCPE